MLALSLSLINCLLRFPYVLQLPKMLLVAREHAISPSTLLQRVAVRRIRRFRQRAAQLLGLDQPRLLPHAYAAVWFWKLRRGHAPRMSTPPSFAPIVTGTDAKLFSAGVWPATVCFVQVDLSAFILRWSRLSTHSLSLHDVEELAVSTSSTRRRSSSRSANMMFLSATLTSSFIRGMTIKIRAAQAELHLSFRDGKGLPRVLTLTFTDPTAAPEWRRALEDVLTITHGLHAGTAFRRWAISCMRSVGGRDRGWTIQRSDVGALLNRVRREHAQDCRPPAFDLHARGLAIHPIYQRLKPSLTTNHSLTPVVHVPAGKLCCQPGRAEGLAGAHRVR